MIEREVVNESHDLEEAFNEEFWAKVRSETNTRLSHTHELYQRGLSHTEKVVKNQKCVHAHGGNQIKPFAFLPICPAFL